MTKVEYDIGFGYDMEVGYEMRDLGREVGLWPSDRHTLLLPRCILYLNMYQGPMEDIFVS